MSEDEEIGLPEAAEPEAEEAVSAKSAPARGGSSHEVAYLRQLIEGEVPVVIKIKGGEEVDGVIEYYDNSFIRLTRNGHPNLFIFKKDILHLRENGPAVTAAAVTPEEEKVAE
jgi:hypothetical protein